MEDYEVTRRGLKREVILLERDIEKVRQQLSTIVTQLGCLRLHIKKFKPDRGRGRLEKLGRFSLGDTVEWWIKDKKYHLGRVILVVPPKTYPDAEFKKQGVTKEYRVRSRGYYRYEESYIIEDAGGQQWWPRVGWLRRVD